ncbi:MAG: hypothetical protein HY735_24075 [Verrucomicrobia bacterium]|nr:hypothetical protein [Verrucomicrobiota bacterium]
MKTKLVICLILLTLAAGGTGYSLRSVRQSTANFMADCQIPGLEYFLTPQTFSEVENAKALLEALSAQFLSESRSKRAVAKAAATDQDSGVVADPTATEAIHELEQGILEFKGTEQELLIVQDLLWLLKSRQQYDRWIEAYLRVLYQHPTHELVGRFAQDAVLIAKAAGREATVIKAFKHVRSIPLEFNAKRKVEVAGKSAGGKAFFAWNNAHTVL